MKRLALALTLGTAALVLAAMPASAQYPPDRPTCRVDRTAVSAGDTARVSGERWQAQSEIDLDFVQAGTSSDVGDATTGADGSFSTRVTIPSNATTGPATLAVSGTSAAGNPFTCRIAMTVVGEDTGVVPRGLPPAQVDGLAVTGFAMWTFLILGAGLLATGIGLVLSARDTRGTGSGARFARRRMRHRAKIAFLVGGLSLLAWLLTAAVAPAAATALSLRHPVTPGTVVLALAVAAGAWIGLRARRTTRV